MKAGVASENGIEVRDVPQPRPKPTEVLVKVRAASLNRADLTTARGLPHGSHGGVGAPVGIDWAGEVVETGAEVQGGFKPGDRVMCSGTGGYAEYAVSDWGRVNAMPDRHELRTGGDLAGRARHPAQRADDRRPHCAPARA